MPLERRPRAQAPETELDNHALSHGLARIHKSKGRTGTSASIRDAHTAKMMTLAQEATAGIAPRLRSGRIAEPTIGVLQTLTPLSETLVRLLANPLHGA